MAERFPPRMPEMPPIVISRNMDRKGISHPHIKICRQVTRKRGHAWIIVSIILKRVTAWTAWGFCAGMMIRSPVFREYSVPAMVTRASPSMI